VDKKQLTKQAYDQYAEKFNQTFGEDFKNDVVHKAEIFLERLSGNKILDLGSGPGNHAEYFAKKGYDVLCIDISEKMIALCREKGLKAEVMDIENLTLPAQSFDGIWAIASLLHVPKSNIPSVINSIAKILKPGGILAVSVKEGSGEKMEKHPNFPGTERLFVYFTDYEIRQLFFLNFELLHYERTNFHGLSFFLNYIFKLKPE
jgi:SAM-dependent methyltransferase